MVSIRRHGCWMLRRWSLLTTLVMIAAAAAAAKPPKLPEVPSTLLKLHKIYTSHPPHDSSLYDRLWLSPNATSADIQKSYRKLSRQYHPDKQRGRRTSTSNNCDARAAAQELETIRQAYEILKDDATRLPYHKYGLQDLPTAVLILTGYQSHYTQKMPLPDQVDLLHLMGYHHAFHNNNKHNGHNDLSPSMISPPPPPPPRQSSSAYRPIQEPPMSPSSSEFLTLEEQQERRVKFLAATILERIRPLVEGTISEATLAHAVWDECDRLKKVPLGAQIIRCVGRAYRHSGTRLLRHHNHHHRRHRHHGKNDNLSHNIHNNKKKLALAVSEPIREKWRDTKHLWTAAVASGRVTLQENWRLKTISDSKKKKKRKKDHASIAYHDVEEDPMMLHDEEDDHDDFLAMISDSDDDTSDDYANEDLQLTEAQKAQKVMIELLQVEALWKVHKIGIDRSVRDACDLILSGKYFFFPSHQSTTTSAGYDSAMLPRADGWVSASSNSKRNYPGEHQVIDAHEGRLRAAKALVMVGDVMVQCSKEGTAWME